MTGISGRQTHSSSHQIVKASHAGARTLAGSEFMRFAELRSMPTELGSTNYTLASPSIRVLLTCPPK